MDPDNREVDRCALVSPDAIRTVAIIGAGLSGLVSAVHLLRAGINITIFERANHVGGAWKYSPQPDRDPPFPSVRPPTPDWAELERLQGEGLSVEEAALRFAPPGPVYANMKSRGSKVIMRTSLVNWPEGSGEPLDHGEVLEYLRDVARIHCVEDKIRFYTRVEALSKKEGTCHWDIRTSRLVATKTGYKVEGETWRFDAVVVATGRYGVPRVPDVPGLSTWKRMFPDRVMHAKQYRTPTSFRGKRVLIIGAFISAMEIAKELTNNGAMVYQSAKDTKVDFRDQASHGNAEKVAMAAKFIAFAQNRDEPNPGPQPLDDDRPIPGQVVLQDGRVLENIHHIIIATGYLTTYPFLGPILEQPFTSLQNADEKVVTTADGRTVHNLHEDIFYIPDPTLAFIGVTNFASTFSLYDFQAQVLAAVFAGRVRLPSEVSMRAEQRRRKSRVLPGTLLNSIFLLDDFVIRRLLDWVNKDLIAGGFEPLSGPDFEWWDASREQREASRSLLGKLQDNYLD
ncbi:Fc.00g034410.m01.CDS01 [Cosmosporella sp. VM-42]